MSRSKKGQSFVELLAGMFILVPIVLLLVDLATLVIGVSSGDNVCREAARAASAGDPSQAHDRANQVLLQANLTKGGGIMSYALVKGQANNVVMPNTNTGGPVQGTVQIDSNVSVSPPFILKLINGNQSFLFGSHQSFPITYTIRQTLQPN